MARTLLFLNQPELAGGITEPRTRSFRVSVEQVSAETGQPTHREWYFMSFSKARKVYRSLAKDLMVSRDTHFYKVCLNRAAADAWHEPLFFASETRKR